MLKNIVTNKIKLDFNIFVNEILKEITSFVNINQIEIFF